MKCYRSNFIELRVTPDELRELANRLEKRFRQAKIGEDVPSEIVETTDYLSDERLILKFMVDQEAQYEIDRRKPK